ncbi:RcnB family protein [Caulobacter sp. 17J65-9]|uniref:RcnB family protein n=1 Tax=Caulobacter sp. 17J65-9 TaxID=2709382 RepID=UPI0013C8AD45|nr:RcnB family protein [Caulobacter sp. 17J65-9]NEX92025.1 RcnB family protein [Caulobacter sp. 17J65-9]
MNRILSTALAAVVAVGALAAAPAADARDRGHGRGHDERGHDDRKAEKFEAKAERARWRAAERRYRAGRYSPPPGHVHHEWRYGERLPPAYYVPVYRLEYERYGLYAPPPGYVWTRVDDKAVLAAIATGVIASVVVDLFE